MRLRLLNKAREVVNRSSFTKNLVFFTSGVFISQAVLMIFSPVLTRIYDASDFGLLGIYVAISSVCFDFITGRYHVPINMPKKDVDAAQILGAGGFFVFFTTVILLFVALLVTIFVSPTGKLEEIFPFLFLIPIAAMCKGVNDLMTSWHVRKGKYGVVSTSRILQSVITCLGQLGLAIFGVKSAGLIWGRFMGEFVGIVFFVLMFSLVYRSFFKEIRLEKVVGSLKRYKDFLFYETPLTVFKSVSSYTPLFLLTHYYSLEVTG